MNRPLPSPSSLSDSVPMRSALLALFSVTSLIVSAPPAHADVRIGTVTDPRDAPEALSGPRAADIEAVRVSYDSTGTLSVTARLYEPFPATNGVHYRLSAIVSSAPFPFPGAKGCSTQEPADALLFGELNPQGAGGTFELRGLTGTVPAARAISPDGRDTTFSVTAPALVNRNYICVGGISVYQPDPAGHCSPSLNQCDRIAYRYTGDTAEDFFFPGFKPATPACEDGLDNDGDGAVDSADETCVLSLGTSEGPPPQCSNRRDDDRDGKVDSADPGCRGEADGASEVDPRPARSSVGLSGIKATRRSCGLNITVSVKPRLTPAKLFPTKQVRLTIKGVSGRAKSYRKTGAIGLSSKPFRLRNLKPGRYRVTGTYPGDRYRLKSKTRSRTLSVCK